MSRMGSSRLWGKITVLIAVCGLCLSGQAKYGGGSGEPNNPYQISSVADWQELMATPGEWASHFVLTGDIDLNDVPITPVGNDPNNFTGVFDGNDYVIRNADVNMSGSNCVGLFGYLRTTGQIKNLGVEDATIRGRWYVGGLVGDNSGTISNCYSTARVTGDDHVGGLVGRNWADIINCYSTGSVSATYVSVGGMVGYNYSGTISNCYASGAVSGTYRDVGGLVGYNYYGTISNCYSIGAVRGDWFVGGLVGRNDWDGGIRNCYSTGTVSGTRIVGGLVGMNGASIRGSLYPGWIHNCYCMGKVAAGSDVGGLVGVHEAGEVTDSFWDIETSDCDSSAGGTPKTTSEMKTESTFTSAGWDFIEFWDIGENQTYPFLRTYLAGDINHDGVVDFCDITHLAADWLGGVE